MSSQPSTFAALLRRSKFASFDPAISQVYTASPAHAYRGDFGFKRPLPRLARKKLPAVVVSRVDTPEYQTEWEDATSQNKFVQRFEELGAPKMKNTKYVDQVGPNAGDWLVDSEFDREGIRRRGQMSVHEELPGAKDASSAFHAMSLSDFKDFKDKTRELRPEFYQYLEKLRLAKNERAQPLHESLSAGYTDNFGSPPKPSLASPISPEVQHEPTSFYTAAQSPRSGHNADSATIRAQYSTTHRQFLGMKRNERLLAHGTTTGSLPIAPLPHAHAGLMYTNPSRLQTVLMSPPRHAHIVLEKNYAQHLAEPPADYLPSRNPSPGGRMSAPQRGFIEQSKHSYAAIFGGGSHVARIDPRRVTEMPSATPLEKEDRVEAFKWFYDAQKRQTPTVFSCPRAEGA